MSSHHVLEIFPLLVDLIETSELNGGDSASISFVDLTGCLAEAVGIVDWEELSPPGPEKVVGLLLKRSHEFLSDQQVVKLPTVCLQSILRVIESALHLLPPTDRCASDVGIWLSAIVSGDRADSASLAALALLPKWMNIMMNRGDDCEQAFDAFLPNLLMAANNLLRQRLPSTTRTSLILLMAELMVLRGSLIIKDHPEVLELALRLTSVELRIHLEDALDDPLNSTSEASLAAALTLLESTIIKLNEDETKGQDISNNDDDRRVIRLLGALHLGMQTLFEFLDEIDQGKRTVAELEPEIAAVARAIAVWTIVEPRKFSIEFLKKALPILSKELSTKHFMPLVPAIEKYEPWEWFEITNVLPKLFQVLIATMCSASSSTRQVLIQMLVAAVLDYRCYELFEKMQSSLPTIPLVDPPDLALEERIKPTKQTYASLCHPPASPFDSPELMESPTSPCGEFAINFSLHVFYRCSLQSGIPLLSSLANYKKSLDSLLEKADMRSLILAILTTRMSQEMLLQVLDSAELFALWEGSIADFFILAPNTKRDYLPNTSTSSRMLNIWLRYGRIISVAFHAHPLGSLVFYRALYSLSKNAGAHKLSAQWKLPDRPAVLPDDQDTAVGEAFWSENDERIAKWIDSYCTLFSVNRCSDELLLHV